MTNKIQGQNRLRQTREEDKQQELAMYCEMASVKLSGKQKWRNPVWWNWSTAPQIEAACQNNRDILHLSSVKKGADQPVQ